MGIFIEDLMHFGRMIPSEIAVDIGGDDITRVLKEGERAKLGGGKLIIYKESKGFLFKRKKEKVLSLMGPEENLSLRFSVIRDDFEGRGEEYFILNIKEILEGKEVYHRIPERLRYSMSIVRAELRDNLLRVYLKMKG